MATTLRVPLEILDDIIGNVGGPETLISIAQTSQTVSGIVWPHLYRSVRLVNQVNTDCFIKAALAHPERCIHIRHVTVRDASSTSMALMLIAGAQQLVDVFVKGRRHGNNSSPMLSEVVGYTLSPRCGMALKTTQTVHLVNLLKLPPAVFTHCVHLQLSNITFDSQTGPPLPGSFETLALHDDGMYCRALYSLIRCCSRFTNLTHMRFDWTILNQQQNALVLFLLASADRLKMLTVHYYFGEKPTLCSLVFLLLNVLF